jgi:hypothetical protein
MDWTTDKKMNNYNHSWDNMAKDHGLKSPQPIMCYTKEFGGGLYMFQSSSKYYIWNPIEGGVWEILTSMNLEGIVEQIAKQGLTALKSAEVDQV